MLPFGISLALRTFTSCMDAALSPLRQGGIRILNYLDECLVCAVSEEQCSEVPQIKVVVSRRLHRALWWWRVPANIKLDRALGLGIYRQLVYTDASSLGWGAVHEGRGVNGVWTGRWLCQHINVLELRAVLLALGHCTVTAAYINRLGGFGSPALCKLATILWQWAHPYFPHRRDLLSQAN